MCEMYHRIFVGRLCVCVCMCVHACMHVRVHVCACVCVRVCVSVCTLFNTCIMCKLKAVIHFLRELPWPSSAGDQSTRLV